MSYDIFLSYARKDDVHKVKKVYDALCGSGFSVWWDQVDMTQRELAFTEEIGQVIKQAQRLILFIGENMPASEYVDAEWRYARKCGVKVYPVLIGSNTPDRFELVPHRLRRMHVRDLTDIDKEDMELDRLISELRQPLSPLASLFNVPALPAGYVEREGYLDELIEYFFNDSAENIGEIRFCSISGMGGAGKSTIASALCHDEEIRRQFEQIIWVRLGEKSTLSDAWRQIAAQAQLPYDLSDLEMRIELARSFESKRCLFVFDNCCDPKLVEFLKNALDTSRNRVLLTFRENTLSSAFGIKNFYTGDLSPKEAAALIAGYCRIKPQQLGAAAQRFIKTVGRHALALAIGAAMYLELGDWDVVIESYYDAEAEFDLNIPNYEYKSVMISIEASVKNLKADMAELFMMLSVFKKEINIPAKQIGLLWEDHFFEQYGEDANINAKSYLILKKLHNKSLLVFNSDAGYVTLHNLVYDYLEQKHTDRSVLEGFIGKISQNKDSYYYEYILYHLIKNRQKDKARTLLFDYSYQMEKIAHNGINSLMGDFDYWKDAECGTLRKFYKLSAHIIKNDPSQTVAQFFGRFAYPNEYEGITGLIKDVLKHAQVPFVMPQSVCMMPPGTAETDIIRMEDTVFSLRSFGGKLISADKSGSCTLLDPKSCSEERIVKRSAWCLDGFVFDGCMVGIYAKNKIVVFDPTCDKTAEHMLDHLISCWAIGDGCFYIADTMGRITRFDKNGKKKQYDCGCGISCLYTDEDGSLLVYCINKEIYRLGEGFERLGETEDRIIKRQGDIYLTSHGKLYIGGNVVSGTGYVRDFDGDVYINNRQEIVIFDLHSGETLKKYKSNNELRTVCKAGSFVFTGDNNQNIYKWDTTLSQLEEDDTKQWINAIASFDGDLYYISQNGYLYKNDRLLISLNKWYNAMVVSDRHILIADNVGEMTVLDRVTLEEVNRYRHGNKITDMVSDGSRLFVSDALGTLSVLDADSLELISEHKTGSWITSVSLLEGQVACSDRYGHIMLYDGETMEYKKTVHLKEEIKCMAKYKNMLAVCFKSNVVKLLLPDSEQVVCAYHPSFSNVTRLYGCGDTLHICTEVNMQNVRLIASDSEK